MEYMRGVHGVRGVRGVRGRLGQKLFLTNGALRDLSYL